MMMAARHRAGRVAAAVCVTLALSGCAEMNLFGHLAKRATSSDAPAPDSTAATNYKIGKPYQVGGVWYYPREDFDYDETGIASWYGPKFHAKLTANGEVFDQNAVSAAHKTLPMPSVVRVTNLDNGRAILVRVNDRGPFVNGRIIDLSRRASQLLGFEGQGTARVRVQIMPEESAALAGKARIDDGTGKGPRVAAAPRESVTAEALPAPGGREPTRAMAATPVRTGSAFDRGEATAQAAERRLASQQVEQEAVHNTQIYVQAGAFSRHDNAVKLSARLSGIGRPVIQQATIKGQSVFRVRFGPLASVEDADHLLDSVIAAGQQDARVVVD